MGSFLVLENLSQKELDIALVTTSANFHEWNSNIIRSRKEITQRVFFSKLYELVTVLLE